MDGASEDNHRNITHRTSMPQSIFCLSSAESELKQQLAAAFLQACDTDAAAFWCLHAFLGFFGRQFGHDMLGSPRRFWAQWHAYLGPGPGRDPQSDAAAGAAAVHIEDQVAQKRCGHRPNKAIVSIAEMVDRIKAAVDAKTDADFVVMARTDALSVDGFSAAVDRAGAFAEAGADAIFAEAMTEIDMYRSIVSAAGIPVLANLTEFGQTPLYTTEELAGVDIAMALYPLSAFRAMNKAALNVYKEIREQGTQAAVVDTMQTRMELYDFLGYHEYEQKLDALFADGKN